MVKYAGEKMKNILIIIFLITGVSVKSFGAETSLIDTKNRYNGKTYQTFYDPPDMEKSELGIERLVRFLDNRNTEREWHYHYTPSFIESNGFYRKVVYFDKGGKKWQEIFFYYPDSNFKRIVCLYDQNGRIASEEVEFYEGYGKQKGYYKRTLYYYEEGHTRRVDYFYTEDYSSQTGIYRGISHYNNRGGISSTEFFFTEEQAQQSGIYRQVEYYNSKGLLVKSEYYAKEGPVIKTINHR
jgi:hypothetical protein